jgi:hypothetical protein
MGPWSLKKAAVGAVSSLVVAAVAYFVASGMGSSSPKLSVAQVHAAAAKVGDHGPTCPLRFDRAAAAQAAGADTPLVPVTDPTAIAWGQVPEGSAPDSPEVRFGMSTVGCTFTTTVHGARVQLEFQLFGASKGSVLSPVAPVLQHDAGVPFATLSAFLAQKLPVGQVRLLQGDATVGVGRFDPDGSGEVVLVVGQVLSGDDKPAAVQFQALTGKLLNQIKL